MEKTKGNHSAWADFKPNGYILNFKTVVALPLRFLSDKDSTLSDSAGTSTNIGEVLSALQGEKDIQLEEGIGDLIITMGSKVSRLGGHSFPLRILGFICRRLKQSQGAFGARFFWYESDFVNEYEFHRFFVICNDAIVEESITFPGSGFNMQAFELAYEPGNRWEEAETRYWYRRFYKETKTGQLMALRPDEPILYYYPEGRIAVESEGEREPLPIIVDKMQSELISISATVRFIVGALMAIIGLLIWKR